MRTERHSDSDRARAFLPRFSTSMKFHSLLLSLFLLLLYLVAPLFSNMSYFRLFQVEYAIEAVKLGSTAVGIMTKQGVILASEKRLTSTLLEPTSVEKIMEIDVHIGAAMSGLIGDARTLIDHARIEAQNHTFTFDEVNKSQLSYVFSYFNSFSNSLHCSPFLLKL